MSALVRHLNVTAKVLSAEIGRFAYKVKRFADQIAAAFRPLQQHHVPPPHPFMVGSYDLTCRQPGCGLGPEEH